jgi:hypothetical protein
VNGNVATCSAVGCGRSRPCADRDCPLALVAALADLAGEPVAALEHDEEPERGPTAEQWREIEAVATPDELAGIRWWNALPRRERRRRLEALGPPANVAECWDAYKRERDAAAVTPRGPGARVTTGETVPDWRREHCPTCDTETKHYTLNGWGWLCDKCEPAPWPQGHYQALGKAPTVRVHPEPRASLCERGCSRAAMGRELCAGRCGLLGTLPAPSADYRERAVIGSQPTRVLMQEGIRLLLRAGADANGRGPAPRGRFYCGPECAGLDERHGLHDPHPGDGPEERRAAWITHAESCSGCGPIFLAAQREPPEIVARRLCKIGAPRFLAVIADGRALYAAGRRLSAGMSRVCPIDAGQCACPPGPCGAPSAVRQPSVGSQTLYWDRGYCASCDRVTDHYASGAMKGWICNRCAPAPRDSEPPDDDPTAQATTACPVRTAPVTWPGGGIRPRETMAKLLGAAEVENRAPCGPELLCIMGRDGTIDHEAQCPRQPVVATATEQLPCPRCGYRGVPGTTHAPDCLHPPAWLTGPEILARGPDLCAPGWAGEARPPRGNAELRLSFCLPTQRPVGPWGTVATQPIDWGNFILVGIEVRIVALNLAGAPMELRGTLRASEGEPVAVLAVQQAGTPGQYSIVDLETRSPIRWHLPATHVLTLDLAAPEIPDVWLDASAIVRPC